MRHSSISSTLARGLALLFLVFLGLSIAPSTAYAQSIIRGDTLNSGEVIDNDVVMSGDDVHLAGTVMGNAFITGRDVVVDGTVEGSLFVIGQRVTINGTVGGGAYVIGVSARLGSTGDVGQNMYFLGVSLVTERASQVGRDLVGLSLGAILQGSVGRDTRLIAGLLQFINLFFDFALGPVPGPVIASAVGRAPGLAQFVLPGDVVVNVFGQTIDETQAAQPAIQEDMVSVWFMDRLRAFLPLLIVSLIGYWFLRGRLEESAAVIKQRPLTALGIGLVGLVLSWAILGAFILVFVLILMAGIWIGQTTFWNIAWLLWSVAFPFAALLFSLFLVFINYGTRAIAAYAMTTWVVDRFAPRLGRVRWLWLIVGLVVIVLLQGIPILGWVIGIIVTAWGIGAAWLAWRQRRAARQVAAVAPDSTLNEPAAVAEAIEQTE